MQDLADEVPVYLHGKAIAERLGGLQLKRGPQNIADNLRRCYEELVDMEVLQESELTLLAAWIEDVQAVTSVLC